MALPCAWSELGQVIDSVENDKVAAWYNDTRTISLIVQRQPGTNTVEVVDRIKKLLPQFREQMPPSVNLDILYDRSQSIRESVNDVKFTLVLTVGLVIMVIFLFLRNVSATMIPSLALPMSIVGTFAAMSLAGYTLDNLSLMALTLSVGFVVDDAIVILENIVRHMEMGKPRMQAALEGGREIGFTILSMTLSLAAVFIPVLFMSGIMGRLFHEFAVVIMVAILISGVRLAEPDAHAVQPLPEAAGGTAERLPALLGEGFRRHARPLRLDAPRGDPPPVPHHAGRRRRRWWPPSICTGWCPRDSFPARTPGN